MLPQQDGPPADEDGGLTFRPGLEEVRDQRARLIADGSQLTARALELRANARGQLRRAEAMRRPRVPRPFAVHSHNYFRSRQIRVIGELDAPVVGRLEEALGAAALPTLVMVDLTQCEFIEAACVGPLIDSNRRRLEEGGRLAIFEASGQPQRLLIRMGLADDGVLFDTEADALMAAAGLVEMGDGDPVGAMGVLH